MTPSRRKDKRIWTVGGKLITQFSVTSKFQTWGVLTGNHGHRANIGEFDNLEDAINFLR